MNVEQAKSVYKELLSSVEKRIEELINPKIEPSNLYESFHYIMQAGGKRIRPVLANLCAGACGFEPSECLDSSVAIEILHNFTLAHDDIMDQSPTRRGRDTVHIKWDEPTGILLGDYMVGFGYDLLPKTHPRAAEIVESYTWGLKEVCVGQFFDMAFNTKKKVSFDEYLEMIIRKTSRLLQISCEIGALVACAERIEIDALKNFGLNLGIAFQIQDDLLDLTADEAELGKRIGGDLLEGKKSFLVVKANEKAKEKDDIELLNNYAQNNGAKLEEIPIYKSLFEKLGVFEDAKEISKEYFLKAKSNISILKDSKYKDAIIWLADSLLERKK